MSASARTSADGKGDDPKRNRDEDEDTNPDSGKRVRDGKQTRTHTKEEEGGFKNSLMELLINARVLEPDDHFPDDFTINMPKGRLPAEHTAAYVDLVNEQAERYELHTKDIQEAEDAKIAKNLPSSRRQAIEANKGPKEQARAQEPPPPRTTPPTTPQAGPSSEGTSVTTVQELALQLIGSIAEAVARGHVKEETLHDLLTAFHERGS